jgi:hypothetical protein
MASFINGNEMGWNPNTSAERRKGPRRVVADRRETIRFELESNDRRGHIDRRQSATSWGSSQPV